MDAALLALGPAPALGPSWLDPQQMLDAFGTWALWGAAAVIFAECGLMLGFFLPGDSLLFTVGLLVGAGTIRQPLWLAAAVLTVAAFAGNAAGYEIGRASGPRIFSKPDSRVFKREYVDKTVAFFDKYGARAIVLARFVPIVRTFITVTAGVGRMDRRRYLTYSGIGGLLWASGVTVLGQLLGKIEFVAKNIELMLIAIVLVSVVPLGVEWLRHRNARPPAGQVPSAGPGGNGAGNGAGSTPEGHAVNNADWTASLPVLGDDRGGVPADQPQRGRSARHAADAGARTAARGLPTVSNEPADG